MTRQPIGDGIYLTYVPSQKFKTGFLSAQMAVPLTRETACYNALLVNVLSRGTQRCPDLAALGRTLDLLYGAQLEPTVRKRGENQLLGFVASCVDDRYLPGQERLLEPLAGLLGEMFCRPALRNGHLIGEYVTGERENLAGLIRSDINSKRAYAARRLIEEMCAGEPYGIPRLGTAQDVEAITAEALEDHYRKLLPQAQLELFYCGSASWERISDAFRRSFAALPRGERLHPAPTLRRPARAVCRVVTEALDVTQGKLCLGYRTDSGDLPATMLMNAMLGGATTAKLFTNVREKLSLCYYADSTYHRTKGLVTVSAGITFADYHRAVEAISRQLEELARGVWEDWELEAARRYLCSALRATEDSASAIEDFLMGQAATGGSETLEGLAQDLHTVTGERVRAAAAALRPDTIYFLTGRGA